MKKEVSHKLIELTRDGYNRSAKDWAGTRMNFWEELASFTLPHLTGRLLDIGCGNARFFRVVEKKGDILYSGCDISEKLLEEAQKYHPEIPLTASSATSLPYKDSSFDCAVSFAVLHHIPGNKEQKKFFEEAARVLVSGGIFIVSVWNIRKTRKELSRAGLTFEGENLGEGHTLMNFSQHKTARYVYGFTEEELKNLIKESPFTLEEFTTLERTSKKGEEENFVLVLRKKTISLLL
jgi:ubiquinone/menaquinone biosynthesis C-methylase UbiE